MSRTYKIIKFTLWTLICIAIALSVLDIINEDVPLFEKITLALIPVVLLSFLFWAVTDDIEKAICNFKINRCGWWYCEGCKRIHPSSEILQASYIGQGYGKRYKRTTIHCLKWEVKDNQLVKKGDS